MLNRQKLLIHLLRLAGRPVSRTELTKWCFLLRMECASGGGASFYDFVPYHYGPFSFALYQEAEKLTAEGYLREDDNTWSLDETVAKSVHVADSAVTDDASRVVSRFRDSDVASVVDYVYERHPAFTVNSKRKKLARRFEAAPAVFTSGYESLSIDAFLNRLVTSGVRRVIDVRNNPIARRYGFHKSTLSRLSDRLEIEYVHVPQLGIRSEARRDLSDDESRVSLFDMYERDILANETAAVETVTRLACERPSVLVCMESRPENCHRSRLANSVARLSKLPIVHLGSEGGGGN